MSASGLSTEATGGVDTGANRLRRHTALLIIVGAAIVVLAIFPHVAQPYYVTLVLPAFAYAIALLGFNLLFGYTGLLSFGHALFVALGAYGAAVLSSKLGIKSFEVILLLSG
ncbi:MAG: ABC transporter permease subunit, partial [Burkholderiaceae bacterium]